jgi:hypothetical protein
VNDLITAFVFPDDGTAVDTSFITSASKCRQSESHFSVVGISLIGGVALCFVCVSLIDMNISNRKKHRGHSFTQI